MPRSTCWLRTEGAALRASVGGRTGGTPRCRVGDWIGNRSSQDLGNLANLIHEVVELVRIERLVAVAERVVGIVMYLDDEAIGPHSDSSARQRRDLVALSSAVAGVDEEGRSE